MSDTMDSLPRKWARVQARVKSGWDREFVDKIAKGIKQAGWQPTERQRETMESMCRVYDAETPLYGEEFVRADGVRLYYSGPHDGWLRVYE